MGTCLDENELFSPLFPSLLWLSFPYALFSASSFLDEQSNLSKIKNTAEKYTSVFCFLLSLIEHYPITRSAAMFVFVFFLLLFWSFQQDSIRKIVRPESNSYPKQKKTMFVSIKMGLFLLHNNNLIEIKIVENLAHF
jgi:hypothetical protein